MMRITTLGDRALVVELGTQVDEPTHYRVQAAFRLLESPPLSAVTEVVPAYTTLTLYYDPVVLAKAERPQENQDPTEPLIRQILKRLQTLPSRLEPISGPIREIPVCYGGEFGPDLETVAREKGLTPAQVIEAHSSVVYLVHMIGFAPGFPYLGGLPECLALPRRTSPRTAVSPGSVGISNRNSCIYPSATPGGWHLLGRTPLRLFRPEAPQPSLLQAGDRVRFCAISPEELRNWKEAE